MVYLLHKLCRAARFKVFTTASLKIQVLWDMTLCRWVRGSPRETLTHTEHRVTPQNTWIFNVELIGKYTLEITWNRSYDVYRYYTNIDLGGWEKLNRHVSQPASPNKTESGASRTWISDHLTTVLFKEGILISPHLTKCLFAYRYYWYVLTESHFWLRTRSRLLRLRNCALRTSPTRTETYFLHHKWNTWSYKKLQRRVGSRLRSKKLIKQY